MSRTEMHTDIVEPLGGDMASGTGRELGREA